MDKNTRKLLTIYKCLHQRDDVDWLYWKRVEGGKGLLSVEDLAEIEKCNLGYYLTETEEEFLKEVKKENIFKDEENPKGRKETITNRRNKGCLKRGYILCFGKQQRR